MSAPECGACGALYAPGEPGKWVRACECGEAPKTLPRLGAAPTEAEALPWLPGAERAEEEPPTVRRGPVCERCGMAYEAVAPVSGHGPFEGAWAKVCSCPSEGGATTHLVVASRPHPVFVLQPGREAEAQRGPGVSFPFLDFRQVSGPKAREKYEAPAVEGEEIIRRSLETPRLARDGARWAREVARQLEMIAPYKAASEVAVIDAFGGDTLASRLRLIAELFSDSVSLLTAQEREGRALRIELRSTARAAMVRLAGLLALEQLEYLEALRPGEADELLRAPESEGKGPEKKGGGES